VLYLVKSVTIEGSVRDDEQRHLPYVLCEIGSGQLYYWFRRWRAGRQDDQAAFVDRTFVLKAIRTPAHADDLCIKACAQVERYRSRQPIAITEDKDFSLGSVYEHRLLSILCSIK
jgi:hypothetical protein